MKFWLTCVVHLLLRILLYAKAYKILGFFPMPARSHFAFNHAIMKSLANAGHQVVVLSPAHFNQFPMENYTFIDSSEGMEVFFNAVPMDFLMNLGFLHMQADLLDLEEKYCNKMMELDEFKKMFRSKEKLFDAIIMEISLLQECFMPLAKKWNVPVIGTRAFLPETIANVITENLQIPVAGPRGLIQQFGVLKTLYGYSANLWHYILNKYVSQLVSWKGDNFYKDHVEVLGPCAGYRELRPSLIFYNNHFTFFPHMLSPYVIEVGGIHIGKEKPLPSPFRKFADEAEHGVIVFTLGSLVRSSTMAEKSRFAFRDAFRQIRQRIVWKYEDEMEDVPENVLLHEWIPQADLLAHENVKAVISHCGMNSVHELIYNAKPVIATPLFSDQKTNAVILEKLGVAIPLDINSATKETVLNAISMAINDTAYLENMQKLSKLFKNRAASPRQSVVYWTEHIIEQNGAPRLAASNLELYEYVFVDVMLCILVVIVVFMFLIYCVLKRLTCFLTRTYKVNGNKKSQ